MIGRLSAVAVTGCALVAVAALPASAASSHQFAIRDVRGVSEWGSYVRTTNKVVVEVCLKDSDKRYPTALTYIAFYDRHTNGDHYTLFNSRGGGKTVCHNYTSHRTAALVLVAEKGTGKSLATWRAAKWGTNHTLYTAWS